MANLGEAAHGEWYCEISHFSGRTGCTEPFDSEKAAELYGAMLLTMGYARGYTVFAVKGTEAVN